MACSTVKLSSGCSMPIVGLGTYDDLKDDRNADAVAAGIDAGYRHIDTAWVYQCEAAVGKGIKRKIDDGTVRREDLFVVSKLWNSCHTRVEEAIRESLDDLGLDYLDLYLVHWPLAFKEQGKPDDPDALLAKTEPIDHDYLDTWSAMAKLVDQGLVRSIGVSNFNQEQLSRLLNQPDLRHRPACNQIESHPYFTNHELVEFCKSVGVVPIAFAPLGRGGVDYSGQEIGNVLEEPLVKNLATKYKKNPGQIVLRWATQRGLAVVPKSSNPARIKGNIQLFDFEMTPKEVAAISSLNRNYRVCAFPEWKELPNFPFVDIKARHGLV
ncbi:aldo-keto reductase family 1 member B7-like [Littorina saxatilis]|uniref:aldo-keto reductase family 1 member B7-like n=1 Tax=Littorina saxatilis TaxID=31220 RepID=UPI0038B63F86